MCPFRFIRAKPRVDEAPEPIGPTILRDGSLLGRWYILWRLAEEMERSRRFHRPLCVVLASPAVPPGEHVSEETLTSGAVAVRSAMRRTDLVGWLEGGRVLVIIPEANRMTASSAVFRWRNEIQLRSRLKWRFALIDDVGRYETVEELLQAATDQLAQRDAA